MAGSSHLMLALCLIQPLYPLAIGHSVCVCALCPVSSLSSSLSTRRSTHAQPLTPPNSSLPRPPHRTAISFHFVRRCAVRDVEIPGGRTTFCCVHDEVLSSLLSPYHPALTHSLTLALTHSLTSLISLTHSHSLSHLSLTHSLVQGGSHRVMQYQKAQPSIDLHYKRWCVVSLCFGGAFSATAVGGAFFCRCRGGGCLLLGLSAVGWCGGGCCGPVHPRVCVRACVYVCFVSMSISTTVDDLLVGYSWMRYSRLRSPPLLQAPIPIAVALWFFLAGDSATDM